MNSPRRLGRNILGSQRSRGRLEKRRSIFLEPRLERLEDRTVLSTITWSTTAAPNGGDWNVATNWSGGVIPGANDSAVIKGLKGAGVVYLDSSGSNSVSSLTTDATATIEVISGSLALGAGGTSPIAGPVIVDQGASMSVAAGATFDLPAGQIITDDGSLSFANGDTVSFPTNSTVTTEIVVDGTLSSIGTKFINAAGYSDGFNQIYVGTGGEFLATNSTFSINALNFAAGSVIQQSDLTGNAFNLPIYVPALDLPVLANNLSFQDIYLAGGTLSTGQMLSLNSIGTKSSANLLYVFPNGFTVASGATLSVAASVPVQIPAGQTITDNGTLSFATGDTISLVTSYYGGQTTQIVVGGLLTATGATFSGSGGYTTEVTVNSGGHFTAANSTFSLTQLSINDSSVFDSGDLTGNTFNVAIYLPYNDVQYLAGNVSFEQVDINASTLVSGTLSLNAIGINIASLQYAFPGGFTVASGATMTVASNLKLLLPPGQTLTDNGTVTFAIGDSVSLTTSYYGGQTTQIVVGGLLTAIGTTFSGSGGYTTLLTVNSGGHITAANSTFSLSQLSINNSSVFNGGDLTGDAFNLPIYVPYNDVQYLASNASFEQVNINASTLASGTLSLNAIGTNIANLQYAFPGGFTIASGATMAIAPYLSVLLPPGQTLTDNGTVSFATGDTVSMTTSYYGGQTTQIVVGGLLTAIGTTFSGSGGYATLLTVNSGGHITAANSTFSLSQLSINNSSVFNSGDLTGDAFNLPIYVPYNDVQYLAGNASFEQVNINAGTLASGTLSLNAIGVNIANLQYAFPGGFTVASGATMAVAPYVSVLLSPGQTLADNGTVSLATGDTVSLVTSYYGGQTTQIVVGGLLTAIGTIFSGSGGYTTLLTVNSGGHITAANSTFSLSQLSINNSSVFNSGDLTGDVFNLPIYVPYNDVQYLAGNASFELVNINANTLISGTLSLNEIGTNIANLQYAFPGGFTVASGATLAVAPYLTVLLQPGQTLTDNGTVSFTTGDTVSLVTSYYGGQTTQIVIGGLLTATSTTFSSSGAYTTKLVANMGGKLTLTDLSFSLSSLTLNSGSTAAISVVTFSGQLNINSAANVGSLTSPTITGDDFSNVAANGIVASGDPNAEIPFAGNYWGTTVIAQIAAKIDDHADSGNLPTVAYQPFISGASGTSALAVTETFSPTSQTINLSATVSTLAGVAINEGTETFTILSGTQIIGQTTAAANVSNGAVSASYVLPANTPAGQYIIEASYSGTANYLPSTDMLHLLTVNAASTTTTVTSVATTFNAASNQSLNLNAHVSSTAGNISEGIVTFTVLLGGNPVGSPVIANVSSDTASATYTLLAATTGGTYTIAAVYTDPFDFKTSTGTSALTVSAAATTISSSNQGTAFSALTGEPISLSANVTSAAGTVNEGAVTFTILDGLSNRVVSPITVSVLNGAATENDNLPAGTLVGSYTIVAVYTGTSSFLASPSVSSTLTISGAATTTTVASSSIGFNSAADSAPITATVTSPGGIVNQGTVTFTILSGSTVIGSPVPATLSSGAASVNYPLPASLALGIYTIQAVYTPTADFGASSDSTHTLTVSQPPASQLAIATAPSSTSTAGQPLAIQPVVDEEDSFGNLETSDNSTVVTATFKSATGTILGTATATVVGGIATLSGLEQNHAGTVTITFSSGNLATATSGTITVNPAAPSQLVITQQPSSVATAGSAFAAQPVVEEADAYGNVITTDSTSAVTVAKGSVGTSSLHGTNLTVSLSHGVATFSGLSYDTAETINLDFSTTAAGVSAIDSTSIVVSPAAASQLVINQQPPATAAVGQPISPAPVIYLEDAYGNLETSNNTTVVTAILDSGVGPLAGTTSATVSGGVARFSGLVDNSAETISLSFTSGTLATAPSSSIVISPAAASKLVIHTEPSSTATAGQPFAVQPLIYVVDQNGNLETGDNTTVVTVSLASGIGPLPGSLLHVTVKGGIATFTGLSDNTAETISLAFSAGGLTTASSNPIVVSPAAPSRLFLQTQPAQAAMAGQSFSPQPMLYEVDKFGNLESGDNSTVITVSLASGNGPLQGTTTATLSGGVATFVNLSDDTAETISLIFSGGGLNAGPSNNIVINPGVATQWVIQTQPYSTVQAGTPLTDPIVLDEEDRYGNILTTDNSTQVTASLASGGGTLLGTALVTVADGVASYNDLQDNKAGSITLRFSGGTAPAVTSDPSQITPAPAITCGIVTRPPGGVVSGKSFTVSVAAFDPYNNVDTSYSGLVTVSVASGSDGSLSGTVTMNATDGTATFTNVVATTSGQIELTAGAAGLSAAPATSAIVVSPAAPSALMITTQPSSTAIAGQPFASQPVISEVDQYGNLVTSDSSTVITVDLATGAGPLQGTVTATLSGGIARFPNLADDTAETISLQFSGAGLTSLPSPAVLVNPAQASQLVISTEPSSNATVHQAFATQPVVFEKDRYGNLETNDNTTPVNATLASGSGPIQGTTSVSLHGGIATFGSLSDNTPETITLSFSTASLSTGSSSSITVSPAAASRFVIETQPSQTATAGQAFAIQPVVVEEDQYGNLESGDSSTVLTAFLGGGVGPLLGSLAAKLVGGVATFANLSTDAAATITLQFTGGGLTAPASIPVLVRPAAAGELVMQTGLSSSAVAGQAFAIQPVIDEEDAYGNIETGDSSTVISAKLNSGTGPLQGTTFVTLHGGVGTFTNLSDDKAETASIEFIGGGITSAPTGSIEVMPAAASKLVIATQPSSTAFTGRVFATQPVIVEEDAYNNLITTDSTTVIVAALAEGSGPLQGTTTVVLKSGVATFINLADDKPETISLAFSGGGLSTGASSDIVVTPAPTQLVIKTEPSSTAIAGQSLSAQPVVYEEDSFGNLVTNDNSTVVALSLATGAGGLQGSTNVTVSGGVAIFSNVGDDVAQILALEFSSGSLAKAVSGEITVSPAAVARLVIGQQPSSSATAGQPFATQPVIYEEDQFGNLEAGDNSSVVSAVVSTGSGPLQGSTSAIVSGGVARFSNLGDAMAETLALEFTSGAVSSSPSNAISVAPAIVINVSPPPAPAAAPAIVSYTVSTTHKLNRKGKPTGPAFLVYTFNFSAVMNSSLGNAANYEIDTAVVKKKVKKFQSTAFTLSVVSSTSVSLTLTSSQKFASGGQIIIRGGLESASNVPLNNGTNLLFAISNRGNTITPE